MTNLMKISGAFLGLASLMLAVAATAAIPQQGDVSDAYIKPHAPVDIRHKVLGQALPGQPVDVEITLLPHRMAEAVSANVSTGPGMRVSRTGRLEKTDDVSRPMARRQVVTFTPAAEGLHYVTVLAKVQLDGQVQSRVVSFPIQVGNSTVPVRKMEPEMGELKPDGQGGMVRDLPAVQTIGKVDQP